jgi:hypothetical protein
MLSDGETGPGVIRDQTLFGVHLPKGESLGVIAQPFASLPEKRSFQFARTFYLPQSIAAMSDPTELVQRTDTGVQRQFLSIQKGYSTVSDSRWQNGVRV